MQGSRSYGDGGLKQMFLSLLVALHKTLFHSKNGNTFSYFSMKMCVVVFNGRFSTMYIFLDK